jgi:hypothetical protein
MDESPHFWVVVHELAVQAHVKENLRRREYMPSLLARWTLEQDISLDPPLSVIWGDGRPATYADYLRHRDDTHEVVETNSGIEYRIYPEIIGHVRFDGYSRRWFVSGESIETTALDLSDPDASDCEIRAELYTFPVIYKCIVHR